MRPLAALLLAGSLLAAPAVAAEPPGDAAPAPFVPARIIEWCGVRWQVRRWEGPPGNRHWDDSEQAVWVDRRGHLHLRLRRIGGQWHQAGVEALGVADYGRMQLALDSRLGRLGEGVVVALFLYGDDEHELDIELTQAWHDESNAFYVVQPAHDPGNRHHFGIDLSGAYSTHAIDWSPALARFESWHGHCPEGPCGGWIQQWERPGPAVPAPSDRLRPMISLWISGDAPRRRQEVVLRACDLPALTPVEPQ